MTDAAPTARLGRTPLAVRRSTRRVPLLVVAAHPDDETIGASALLVRTPGCVVVHLTDGAPARREFWAPGVEGAREEYARLRRGELLEAMRVAGVAEDGVRQLGAVDQEAVRELDRLTAALAELVATLRPKRVVTHPYEGGHPDHDAAAFVARAALDLVAARGIAVAPLFEMTSYHAAPDGTLESGEFLGGAAGPVHARALSPVERATKDRMLAAFASQREVIAWFRRDVERLRRAPRYDFTRPPHQGRLWYERMGFPLSGEEWRACATEALARLSSAERGAALAGRQR